jgi:Zn-dependent M16 (insulinase) family peptidase
MLDSATVHPSFEPHGSRAVPSLNIEVLEYRHSRTRARHIHLAAEDTNNAFLVAFRTVPQDSTGVAHILEHTSLCGSQHFPVRDPFFMMTRRSLNTFMNAFTSSDWTAYPFASQNRKDFDNLLRVYLDAVFFPRLDELDFAQEGHRLEFEVPEDASTPLVYRGVVYNEMKGAMSSPVQTLWQYAHRHLFPTITYHHNSGGEPQDIPDLSHAQLKAFHARHYHPSNAVFMTYGDISAREHQARFEELALSGFEAIDTGDLRVPDEQRLAAPVRVREPYAVDETQQGERRAYVLVSWLLGPCTDPRQVMNARLLEGVLLDNSSSPLRRALETTGLGTAPAEVCGLDDSTRELGFYAGLEGASENDADAIEELVLATLRAVAQNGVPTGQVESVLHQMELSQREITGGGFPYGLHLMVNALTPAIHEGDPVSALDIEPVLEALRSDIADENFVKALVREQLLENSHRVRLVMAPEPGFARKTAAREAEKLRGIAASFTADDCQHVVAHAAKLQARQEKSDDPEVLPKVTLSDVPDELAIPAGWRGSVAGIATTWYPQGTNGMVYQQVVADLPALTDELRDVLPLFCSCVTELGCGELDYAQAQAWQASVTGSLAARLSVRTAADSGQRLNGYYALFGKALARNAEGLAEVLRAVFERARFDELERIRELVAQQRAYTESGVTDRGHALAMAAACAGLSPSARLSHQWGGLKGLQGLKALDESLREDAGLREFAGRLESLRERLLDTPLQVLSIGEPQRFAQTSGAIARHWRARAQPATKADPFAAPPARGPVRQAWLTGTQVSFCAKAYPAVPADHPDAAALAVLGEILRNGYLHPAIREKGGAYGAGAGYDSDACGFRFFSYRDPRLVETLNDFDRSLDWLLSSEPGDRELEEAVLGMVSAIDRPDSPAGEAVTAFYGVLHGRDAEQRRRTRSRVLAVTFADLRRVAETYLKPDNASIAVLTSEDIIANVSGLELEPVPL